MLSLVLLNISNSLYAQCRVDELDISTGIDQTNGSPYSNGFPDEFWAITNAPQNYSTYIVPVCAISRGWTGFNTTPSSRIIGFSSSSIVDGNYRSVSCVTVGAPYTFRRQFEIDNPAGGTTPGNIEFTYEMDDWCEGVDITGPGVSITLSGTPCLSGGSISYSGAFIFSNGVYTLKFHGRNRKIAQFGNAHSKSNMELELYGFVRTTGVLAITDNKHFGKNAPTIMEPYFCASQYKPRPNFTIAGSSCIDAGTTSTYIISPFNNGAGENVYTLIGTGNPTISATGTFNTGVGTYTVTSTDAIGCSYSTTLNVFANPNLTLSPSPLTCINSGTYTSIVPSPSPNSWNNYGWQINSGPPFSLTNPSILLTQGFYTITAIDANGCTATSTTKIGNNFTLWTSATPPCISPGGTSILNAGPLPTFTGSIGYSYNGGPFVPGPQYTATSAGTYTVVCKDQYGCTASSAIIVNPIPNPGLTLAASQGCVGPTGSTTGSSVITATATTGGPYFYQINYPGVGWLTPQSSNVFTAYSPGQYHIRVVDLNGCESLPATIYIGDCNKCLSEIPPSNAIWYKDPLSSAIFSNGQVPVTPIVIEGTLSIDNNLNIWNNPNVFFTYFSEIKMINNTNNTQLYISNSTLKPCYFWWKGITADNDKQRIAIDNNSLLKKMGHLQGVTPLGGVYLTDGAVIDAKNSRFEDNFGASIQIRHALGVYPGIIQKNIFTTNAYSNANFFNGIFLDDMEDCLIGGSINNVNDGNTFKDLLSGIRIISGYHYPTGTPPITHYKIYNNYFNNIKDLSNAGTYNELNTLVNSSSINSNAAILGLKFIGKDINGNPFYPNQTIEVKNFTNSYDDSYTFFPGIYNGDRAIVTTNSNLIVDNVRIENTLLGIMDYTEHRTNYSITNNFISKAHLGIQMLGDPKSVLISSNIISTRNAPIQIPPGKCGPGYYSPIGIDIKHYNPLVAANITKDNLINMTYITGVGIKVQNADQLESIIGNNINFGSFSTAPPVIHLTKAQFGLWVENCNGTFFNQNTIKGYNSQSLMNIRNSIGVYMNNSPKCILTCNRAKYTRFGFYAWADNLTSAYSIQYNKFSANRYPWNFLDAGASIPATFGNVGGGGTDKGNNFVGLLNWLNSNQFKVFRNSSVPSNFQINTSNILLSQNESGSTSAGSEYQIINSNGTNSDPCGDPSFIINGDGSNVNNGMDDDELAYIQDVVDENVDYIDHAEVGAWIDENRVYRALDEDSTLRYSSIDMQAFYDSRQGSLIGKIYEASKAIALLGDTSTNSTNFASRYNLAAIANNAIVNGETWEMNEHDVNAIHLKLLSGSVDTIGYDTIIVDSLLQFTMPKLASITEVEKDFLETLALSCPFVEGTSVYKARALWALFDAGREYDDRVLCINASNKNMNHSDIDIDSLYESQIENKIISPQLLGNNHKLKDNNVLIYPNPANSSITVEYTCMGKGQFELSTGMGQVVLKSDLEEGKRKVQIQVGNLSNGIYYYKCSFEGCESVYGKLTIGK